MSITSSQKREAIINELTLTYLKKNKDYGNSASETYELFGDTAYQIRIHDKLKRIERLLVQGAEVQESIDDTIMDLIVYSALWRVDSLRSTVYTPIVVLIESIESCLLNPCDWLDDLVRFLPTKFRLQSVTREYIEHYIQLLTQA